MNEKPGRKMSNERMHALNRMLIRNGFGPQTQGVVVDWDGLDDTLRQAYGAEERASLSAQVRADLEKKLEPIVRQDLEAKAKAGDLGKKIGTRKRTAKPAPAAAPADAPAPPAA